MKTLKLTFRSGSHSTRTMQLKYVAEELDEATIKQAMQEIGELQLFENKGVQKAFTKLLWVLFLLYATA